MNVFEKLEEFHTKFNHPVNGEFIKEQVKLRYDLIDEEADEVFTELARAWVWNAKDNEMVFDAEEIDAKALTKELADLLYVTIGTAVAFGLPLEQVFNETHKSNMSKLGDDGKPVLREDGKILKGKNYRPPNLDQFF